MKDAVQCFILKRTTGKYFMVNKKDFIGSFGHLLIKPKIYECVEAKGKILKEGETLGYWNPVYMSMFFLLVYN